MDGRQRLLTSCSHFLHAHLLGFLVGSYMLAALCPAGGLWLRSVSLGAITLRGETTHFSLTMLMLAFLLLNAGLGVQTAELRNLRRSPRLLLAGLGANLLVPLAFIVAVSQALRWWHNADEVQHILVGLALVAAMPIAGSSTAWAQNANGDLALSLGLVLFSTFLSPVTTPITFDLVEHLATGSYARALSDLESQGSGAFLMLCVLLPSLLGMVLHRGLGEKRVARVKPELKLVNSVNLLLLNYANAAVSLPQAVAQPDWDFLAVILLIVVGLCVSAFAAGWWLGRLLDASPSQRSALMFGLGMNNNGTALVLASLTLADSPRVLLPIIAYNLVQHLVAGGVDRLLNRPTRPKLTSAAWACPGASGSSPRCASTAAP